MLEEEKMSTLIEESQLAACSIVPGQNSKQSEVDIFPKKLFRGLSTVGNFAVATLNYFLISSILNTYGIHR